jgi:hypothetical protein
MGTVSGLIDSARYDLIDYETGIVFDDTEILNYLNRMIEVMDSELAVLGSHLVHRLEENIDTVASQNYVDISSMNNGYWDSIRSFWIGQDRLTGLSVDELYYERKFRSGNAYPFYWSLDGDRILFESPASEAYNDTVTFTNATDLVTSASAVTYNGGTAVTADGPFRLSNYGGALPAELSEGTDYYLIVVSTTTFKLATTAANATAGTAVSFSDDGTGTSTIQEDNGVSIHYNKKNRPRLLSWSDTFTANAATDVFTVSPGTTFTTGDGRFQVSTDAADLPAGLTTGTDYWIIYITPTKFRLATSKVAAMENDYVNITDAGTGNHTITLTDYMPYRGIFDQFLREQLVSHAKAKREGAFSQYDQSYNMMFRKKAIEETLRREMYMPEYYIEF